MKAILKAVLDGRLGDHNMAEVMKTDPIVFMKFGSKLYGSNVPESDDDFRGVFLPSEHDLLLGKAPRGLTTSTRKNAEGHKNGPKDVDLEFYSLYRFLELVSEGQTVAFDMLFTPTHAIISQTPTWSAVIDCRQRLLNKKCGAAVGYARAQAERYSLRGDRIKVLERVLAMAQPYYEKDPRMTVEELVDAWGGEAWRGGFPAAEVGFANVTFRDAPHLPEGREKLLEICGKSVGFLANIKTAVMLWNKCLSGYGERARLAKEGGADWKAMYHAVRVCAEAVELLTTHRLTFPRPEAEVLLKIRRGGFAPQAVSEMIEKGVRDVYAAQAVSTLPAATPHHLIDDILIAHYGRKLKYGELLATV